MMLEDGQVIRRMGVGFASRTRNGEASCIASGVKNGDLAKRIVCIGGSEHVVTCVRKRICSMRCAGAQKSRAMIDGAAHGAGGAVVGWEGRYIICATYNDSMDEGRAIKAVEDLLDDMR